MIQQNPDAAMFGYKCKECEHYYCEQCGDEWGRCDACIAKKQRVKKDGDPDGK
jgi:hypothetical protein